jgi:hypothetical protein
MNVKYYRADKSFPPLVPVRPIINGKSMSAGSRKPSARPAHCKPWLDGYSQGCLLLFPYRVSLQIAFDETMKVICSSQSAIRRFGSIVSSFSDDYFGIATNYRLKTDRNIGIYVSPAPSEYKPTSCEPIRGLIETWWYPRPIFLVFRKPSPGTILSFEFGQPLCLLLPTICETTEVEEFTESDLKEQLDSEAEYLRISNERGMRWISRNGDSFSRAYKVFSKKNR